MTVRPYVVTMIARTRLPVNVLTADQSTFEGTGSAATWVGVTTVVKVRDTSQSREQTASLKVTNNDSFGFVELRTTPPTPWTPTVPLTGMVSVYDPAGTPTVSMFIRQYDISNVQVSNTALSSTSLVSGGGSWWDAKATLNAGTVLSASAKVSFDVVVTCAFGAFVYIDRVGLFLGSDTWTSADWVAGV